MTVTAIFICGIISLFIIGACAIIVKDTYTTYSRYSGKKLKTKISIFAAISITCLIVAITWVVGGWYCTSTAAGQRAMKTQRSEFGDGIQREVTVYDMDGDVIEHYEGRFDVDVGSDGSAQRILFDDEEGNRHVIYPGGGIVIINEVTE